MSIKNKTPYWLYATLCNLYEKDYPEIYKLSNRNIRVPRDEESRTFEVIVKHGLTKEEFAQKIKRASEGEENELSQYLNDKGCNDQDKSPFVEFSLLLLGVFIGIMIYKAIKLKIFFDLSKY